ncbi:MAG: alpha/beta hydrolase [Yoonia sp.]|uniref:alpha/beta hydrolase n=1 Tax=Yoonia sp. TaxID=2212373 RepID=UPI0032656EC6
MTDFDWDDAFANSAYIPGSETFPDRWASEAAAYRKSGIQIEQDIAYGAALREVFDLILPDGAPQGLAVFVHGGYWMQTDKSMWTACAEGALARGWAVCLPSYTLAPEARITDITKQITAAITHAATLVSGPIRIAGHSAGGHLVARMVCADSPIADRIDHALSISGVHDLRPLMQTKMNATLRLDEAEADRESPALLTPHPAARITAWVGGNERPEFIRQAQLFGRAWSAQGAQITCQINEGRDHFSVIEGLKDPNSRITHAFVG